MTLFSYIVKTTINQYPNKSKEYISGIVNIKLSEELNHQEFESLKSLHQQQYEEWIAENRLEEYNEIHKLL